MYICKLACGASKFKTEQNIAPLKEVALGKTTLLLESV